MTTTTGNATRDTMIRDCLAALKASDPLGENPLDVAHVAPLLPADFDLGEDELAMFTDEKPDVIDAEFVIVEQSDSTAAPAEMAAAPTKPLTQAEIDKAADAVMRLTDELSQCRVDVNVAQRRHGEAVTRRNKAVSQFIAGRQPYSPDQLARDSAHAAMMERAAIANGSMEMPVPPRPGNSRVDEVAAYSKGSSIDSGHGNFRRAVHGGQKIYPSSARGAYVGAPKLPSQR